MSARAAGASVNGGQVTDIQLLVLIPGRPPMSVETADIVPFMYLARTRPGSNIPVRIMLDDPSDVYVDWTAA